MKFDDLDSKMRLFETASDTSVLPGLFMVARIDGRNFTRLTKEIHQFEAPFDIRFRDYMIATVQHLMNTGFNIIYGHTQSDEISLLFHPGENAFERKLRKYNSILAGEASAKFSLLLGDIGAFDCRLSQLPTADLVVDYFRWRSEDAHRNALNAHCYWMLRKQGYTIEKATQALHSMSVPAKNELLFQNAINFNDLPSWQKRGVGLYWEHYEKQGMNPKANEVVQTQRRRVRVDYELPMKEAYGEFIQKLLG
jgi:tRNA(His) guanylyltransferase